MTHIVLSGYVPPESELPHLACFIDFSCMLCLFSGPALISSLFLPAEERQGGCYKK